MDTYEMYRKDTIKRNINIAIQLTMFYNHGDDCADDVLLEVQSRLYEQFGIDEEV